MTQVTRTAWREVEITPSPTEDEDTEEWWPDYIPNPTDQHPNRPSIRNLLARLTGKD